MFTGEVEAVLKELEDLDARDSRDGTPKEKRVRCVTPTVARLLHVLALARRPARIFELGTSAGYSTICLAAAARQYGGRVISVEIDQEKMAWASRNLTRAGLQNYVELRWGEALAILDAEPGPLDFVFMDHAARLYLESFRRFRTKLSPGALIVTDGWGNVERWETEPCMHDYAEELRRDPAFATFLLPVEKGELIAVRK